jgi:hypothetical protein
MGQQIYKKNENFTKKKYMFSILKLKRAKNLYGVYPTDFFPGTDKNYNLPPLQNYKLPPTSREYTRIYQRK